MNDFAKKATGLALLFAPKIGKSEIARFCKKANGLALLLGSIKSEILKKPSFAKQQRD